MSEQVAASADNAENDPPRVVAVSGDGIGGLFTSLRKALRASGWRSKRAPKKAAVGKCDLLLSEPCGGGIDWKKLSSSNNVPVLVVRGRLVVASAVTSSSAAALAPSPSPS